MKNFSSCLALLTILFATLTGCEKPSTEKETSQQTEKTDPQKNESELKDENIPGMPDFKKIQVVGDIGNGVVASFLKGDGRDLSGTESENDSVFVNSADKSPQEVSKIVLEALKRKKVILIDGSDDIESSKKLNSIMSDSLGFSVSGITSYALTKSLDGKLLVTPLQSVINEKGVREYDQVKNYLTDSEKSKSTQSDN